MPTNRETYFKLIKLNNKYLTRMVIKTLLNHINGFNNDVDLYKNFDLDCPSYDELMEKVERICSGEPFQYVLGYANFIDHYFKVTKDVLIPRQETEQLVINAKTLIESRFKHTSGIKICDVGTGSGVIGISLKRYFKKANVYATDISKEALEVAKENATLLNQDVEFFEGDCLTPLLEKNEQLDVIISNPPYIKDNSTIDEQVWNFEPHLALLANPETTFYEKILKQASDLLKPGGLILFEIGENMVDTLDPIVAKYCPGSSYYFMKDMYNKYRFLYIINQGDELNA